MKAITQSLMAEQLRICLHNVSEVNEQIRVLPKVPIDTLIAVGQMNATAALAAATMYEALGG